MFFHVFWYILTHISLGLVSLVSAEAVIGWYDPHQKLWKSDNFFFKLESKMSGMFLETQCILKMITFIGSCTSTHVWFHVSVWFLFRYENWPQLLLQYAILKSPYFFIVVVVFSSVPSLWLSNCRFEHNYDYKYDYSNYDNYYDNETCRTADNNYK